MPVPTNPNRSDLDQTQIMQRSFDEATDRLRVDADVTIESATIIVETDYHTDSMAIGDPVTNNLLKINNDGSIDANVVVSQTNDSIRLGDGTNLVTSTTIGPKQGLDVNVAGGVVSGTFTSSGLSTNMRNTVITVTDVATKIPSSPLSGRNTIAIRIWGAETVYIGDSSVTATNGYPKMTTEEIFMDVKDNAAVEVYGICAAGKTCEVRVMEIA